MIFWNTGGQGLGKGKNCLLDRVAPVGDNNMGEDLIWV